MLQRKWSEKDLVKKWGRKFPDEIQRSLPWEIMNQLATDLSEDTKIDKQVLTDCIRKRDLHALFALSENLDVTGYTSPDLLLQDRLVTELFKKFDFVDSPFNKREKAKLRFFEAEVKCREANHRISRSIGLTPDVNNVIHIATRQIEKILGKFCTEELPQYGRFGPGSTLCVSGPFTTEYFKLCERSPTVSTECFPYAEALIEHDPQWKGYLHGIHPFDVSGTFEPLSGSGVELQIADHNKVAFVPKNAKTERSIAIEPYFNVFFQLAIGSMIRKRLYNRCKINLDSQLRNQTLAKIGSITGALATIDFSMASDTISREVVYLLLPPEWVAHLDRLRSKTYVLDGGKPQPWHKFSSMGNGYTFELETLIFYAVACASCVSLGIGTEDVTVFGDDVVLPVTAVPLFNKACSYLGFTVNDEKSFTNGFFRESCGEDYLKGVEVRPVFCKELSTVQHAVSLANRLSALNRAVGVGSRVNDMLRNASGLLLAHVPRDVRRLVVGPPSEDVDGYIHETGIEQLAASELVRWNRRLFAWEHPVIRFRAKKLQRRDDAAALWLIWSLAVKRNPIPKQRAVVEGLRTLAGGRFSDLADFASESIPREITGRKFGSLSLGHNLVWSLGDAACS